MTRQGMIDASDSSHMFESASAEFRLVAACCFWPACIGHSEAVRCALQRPLQWERVLLLARRHRVSALVADALASCDLVPEEVQRTLAEAKRDTLLASMHALRTQIRLTKAFQERSLSFAVLKGTPLAMQAYGSLALRQSRDVDLLVNETDLPRVDELLQSAGYRLSGLGANLKPHQQQLWMRSRKHHEYVSGSGGIRLEVHWRTTDNRYLMRMPDPLSRCEFVNVAPGVDLPTLEREDLLLDLCVHGAGHAWFRLKWLADVAALLHRAGAPAQLQLLQAAGKHGLERPVLQALHLCHAVFDLPVVEPAGQVSTPVKMLLSIAAAALMQEDLKAPTPKSDFVPRHLAVSNLLLRSDWRYRLQELRLELVSPADWQVVDLPPALRWMYPLLRLPLWLKRRWLDSFRLTSATNESANEKPHRT